MPHIAAVALLLLPLSSAPAPAPPAEEFIARLQAPVSLEDVAVDVADNELEISFDLREVGPVSLIVHTEGDGSGRGLVTAGDAVVVEVGFVGGALAWEKSDFSALSPAQTSAVAAGLVQVWHEDAVTAALLDARDLKCTWAGKVAGATIGIAVFAGCGISVKKPKCYGWGIGVGSGIASYITNKCNGAQNK